MKRELVLGITLAFLITCFMGGAHAVNSEYSNITIQPESQTVAVGDTFTVNVSVDLNSTEEINGVSVDHLAFPPDFLNATNVESGDIFSDAGGFLVFESGTIYNNAGNITYTYGTASDLTSTSGTFVTVTFKLLKRGSGSILLKEAKLSDGESPDPPPYYNKFNATVESETPPQETNPPLFRDQGQALGSLYAGQANTLWAEGYDNESGLSSATLYVSGSSVETKSISGTGAWTNVSFDYTPSLPQAGTSLDWYIEFEDSAGNTNSTGAMSFSVTGDTTDPLWANQSQAKGVVNLTESGTNTFSAKCYDDYKLGSAELYVDGSRQKTRSLSAESTWTAVSFDYSTEDSGNHSWYITCVDYYSNTNSTDTMTYEVVGELPVITGMVFFKMSASLLAGLVVLGLSILPIFWKWEEVKKYPIRMFLMWGVGVIIMLFIANYIVVGSG